MMHSEWLWAWLDAALFLFLLLSCVLVLGRLFAFCSGFPMTNDAADRLAKQKYSTYRIYSKFVAPFFSPTSGGCLSRTHTRKLSMLPAHLQRDVEVSVPVVTTSV
jgi:hypothetical protein